MIELYCPIRKVRCHALPEEAVRIGLLNKMILSLGFPEHSLAVEKDLRLLPHLPSGIKMPNRRADILCFAKGIHSQIDLYPLLMIECKAVKITDKVIGQVTGYNHYVGAYFVCLANGEDVRTGWRTPNGTYEFVSYLPSYADLKNSISSL